MDCTSFSASQISECSPHRMQQTTKILQVIIFFPHYQ